MNGRLWIAVTELSLQKRNNQNLGDHGFPERVILRRLLLAFIWRRCPAHAGLLPNKIQEREDILGSF